MVLSRLVPLALTATTLAATTLAQPSQRDFLLANPTGQGSAVIDTTVWFPSATGPHSSQALPAVVFLHGDFQQGRHYADIARRLAERGYLVVLPNTHPANTLEFGKDALAMFAVLRAENERPESPLFERVALDRVAVAGHSYGGSHTIGALTANPGYRAGMCIAPHSLLPLPAYRPEAIQVPLAFVANLHDRRTPPLQHLEPTWARANAFRGVKVKYLIDKLGSDDHMNVAFRGNGVDAEVFDLTFAVLAGTLDRWLRDDPSGLAFLKDVDLRRSGELVTAIEAPDYFLTGEPRLDRTASLHVVGAPGLAIQVASLGRAEVATPWGTLLLDPRTLMLALVDVVGPDSISTLDVPIPDVQGLRGLELHYQALALDGQARLRWTRAVKLAIQ